MALGFRIHLRKSVVRLLVLSYFWRYTRISPFVCLAKFLLQFAFLGHVGYMRTSELMHANTKR